MDSTAKSIFKKSGFTYGELDDFFAKIASEISDGYISVHQGNASRYFVFIAGEPYSAAVSDGSGRRLTKIVDFFDFCRKIESFDLEAFTADKKMLLCMLVGFAHKPTQSFTTDVVDVEDSLKKIHKAGSDCIMILQPGPNTKRSIGFAIFVKGDAAFVFLPIEAEEGNPMYKLLDYCYSLGEGESLAISIFNDTKVTPAADAGPFPVDGITGHYGSSDVAPFVELSEGGSRIGIYNLGEEVTIGRDNTNAIVLPEAGVSREHAVIREKEGKYFIEDLGSANGTSFKNIKIEKKELSNGDEITIRSYTLKVVIPNTEEELEEVTVDGENLAESTIYGASVPAVGTEGEHKAVLIMADGSTVELHNITSIGKDEDCDIVIEGITIGKRHATIVKGKAAYSIMKKGGMASVKVNGHKIENHTLNSGDKIEVGGQTMIFDIK